MQSYKLLLGLFLALAFWQSTKEDQIRTETETTICELYNQYERVEVGIGLGKTWDLKALGANQIVAADVDFLGQSFDR